MFKIKTIFFVFTCLLLSSCASIVDGKHEVINVSTSTGEQVKATVASSDGTQNIILPSTVVVRRSENPISITVNETNCLRKSQAINSPKLNLWTFGNIIFLYFSGFSVTTDAMTGAYWEYDDSVIVPVYKKDSCKQN